MSRNAKLLMIISALALGACSSAGDKASADPGFLSYSGTSTNSSSGNSTSDSDSSQMIQNLSPSNLLTENKTFRIPSEYLNLQSALDEAQKYHPHTFTINILIEGGHLITDGAILNRTDLSFVEIQCEDAVVKISGAFPENKDILFGTGTRMPTLNCLFDMEGRGSSGIRVVAGSQIQVRENAGVKNAARYGLQVQHGSSVYAVRTVWTGAGLGGIYANASFVSAIEADVSGSSVGVYADSGASVNFRGGMAQNTGTGLSANLSSEIDATYSGGAPDTEAHRPTDVSNASEYGIYARNLARVVFIHGKASNANKGVLSQNGASVQVTSANFSGNTIFDLSVNSGGTIIANGSNAQNLNGLTPNIVTAAGVIFK